MTDLSLVLLLLNIVALLVAGWLAYLGFPRWARLRALDAEYTRAVEGAQARIRALEIQTTQEAIKSDRLHTEMERQARRLTDGDRHIADLYQSASQIQPPDEKRRFFDRLQTPKPPSTPPQRPAWTVPQDAVAALVDVLRHSTLIQDAALRGELLAGVPAAGQVRRSDAPETDLVGIIATVALMGEAAFACLLLNAARLVAGQQAAAALAAWRGQYDFADPDAQRP